MKREASLMLALLLLAAPHVPSRTAAARTRQQQQTPTAQQLPTSQQQSTSQQQPTPQPSPAEDSDEDVVRITTNLVQFDAVVTDKQGRLVTDLRPEEFEILVDGKRQEITNLSFISSESGTVTPRPVARPDKTAPPPPPVPLRVGQVHRTIALLVDDLGTSFQSLIMVRRALNKFVDEQMQPGDLVAVMQTGRGLGALQQFTTDKLLLHRAIERVRWNPLGRSGTTAFAALEQDPLEQYGSDTASAQQKKADEEKGIPAEMGIDEFREEIFTVGTLGALNFTIRGMKELPGRKSIVMFGDGLPIFDREDLAKSNHLREKVRQLADLANRASVVIYTMDARGLPYTGLTAADSISPGRDPNTMINATNSRAADYSDSQEGLRFLAEQTGGLFVHETNDLGGGIERIIEDQKGYYLIGFRPDASVFERVKGSAHFNNFEVKVRRSGLRVRTRAGFYGIPESEAKPVRRTRAEQILAAITSPLTSGELSLRLTSLFNSPAEKTSVVDSLMHIDMSQFKFTDEPDGWKKAVIDVVALTFGEDGQVIDELNRTETVRARGDAFSQILKHGVVYAMKVPIKKPGAYQLRVAVRDALSEKLGSASQFIEVPDLKKDRLALSGIFMTIVPVAVAPKAGPAAAAQQTGGADADDASPLQNATVRRFRHGSQVEFQYHIYNARTEGPAGHPQLQTQVRLFHDGQPVFTGPLQTYDPGKQTDMSHLLAGGRLQLGASLQPGDYVLQVVVNDALAKGKSHSTAQWIDFEIVK
jgi:VWFA-related protein